MAERRRNRQRDQKLQRRSLLKLLRKKDEISDLDIVKVPDEEIEKRRRLTEAARNIVEIVRLRKSGMKLFQRPDSTGTLVLWLKALLRDFTSQRHPSI
jgi:hypothetical protein